MNMIYLKNTDVHLNLDRIERVRHDVVLPVVASGEGLTIVKKKVTVVYLMGDSDTRLHVYDSDDRALLRERLGEVDKSKQEAYLIRASIAPPPEEEPPADDWRDHGTLGYDARMAESSTRQSNVGFGVDLYVAIQAEREAAAQQENAGIDTSTTEATGQGVVFLGQLLQCPWSGCGKDIDVAADSCSTGSTWSLFQCRSCGKLCASGNHIPTAVRMDPDILIIK